MDSSEYARMGNEELLSRLDNAALADRLEHSEDWKIVREGAKRLADQAIEQLLKTAPTEQARILELQFIAKFCRDMLPSIVAYAKQDGFLAFYEAKDRGIISPPVESGPPAP